MQLAIISDVHDNIWNLSVALQAIQSTADVLFCCGDLCSPFVIDVLARFPRDIHVVFGNNDADLFRITDKASSLPNVHPHGELFVGNFDGKMLAMNHFDYIARPIAQSQKFDIVCFGHNHELELTRDGNCQLINPGCIMGAKFSSGWQDVTPTFVLYNTQTGAADVHQIQNLTRP